MKSSTLIAVAAIGVLTYFLFKKTSSQDDASAVSPSQLSALASNPNTGINYPETYQAVEVARSTGANNAQIANQLSNMQNKSSNISKPGTSSAGYYFSTSGGKTGYASSAVTRIKSVPKEQSIAYKLGYIK